MLTRNGRDDTVPSWSPDGGRIAFSHYNGQRERVDVLDLRTGRVRDLGDGFNPDWSPDGKRLVFLDAENFDDLVTMNADGSDRRNLNLTGLGIADETDPAWSPDGKRIAFIGDGLYVVGADGTGARRVRPEGNTGRATWSRDGSRIAFDCVTRRFEVCTVGANGSSLRGVTNRGRHPSWSPRGNLLALTRGDAAILLVRPDGSPVRLLRRATDAAWSPGGRWLVATHEVGTESRLYATDALGRRIARLTPGRHADGAPAWSPDGRSIAFRRSGRHCSLDVLDVATRNVRVLVARTGDAFCLDRPEWSPSGKRIVYSSRGDLWSVSRAGGRPRRLTRTRDVEESPRFAPDGRSIGFVDRSGIWLLHADGQRTILVPGGGAFAWSHDRRSLAYLVYNSATDKGSDLYVREGSNSPRKIAEQVDWAPSWSPNDSLIAFTYSTYDSGSVSSVEVSDLNGNILGSVLDSTQPDWRQERQQ